MEEKATQTVYRRQRKNKISNVEVLTEAQKLAFAPLTFQVVACLLDFNILQTLLQTPMTSEDIVQKCSVSQYTVSTLFDAALCAGLLQKNEKDEFSLTRLAEAFVLDPMTIANFNFVKDVCYLGASELKNSFEKGEPLGLKKFLMNSETIYEVLPKLPAKVLKSWYDFDHYYSDDCFDEVLNIIFEKKTQEIFDIGGNTGKFEKACLEFHSSCIVNMIDLPVNIEKAKHNFCTDRIRFHALDILKKENNLPYMSKNFSAVLMSQFLDCFSEKQILHILNKVAEKINNDTPVYILEPFIDNQEFKGAAFSLAHISLYFTCMANGNSKMYNESDMKAIIKHSKLKLINVHYNIGKYDYTLLECMKA